MDCTQLPRSFYSLPLQNGYVPVRIIRGELVPLGMYEDLIDAELHLLDEPDHDLLSQVDRTADQPFALAVYLFKDGEHVDDCLYLDLSEEGNWFTLRPAITHELATGDRRKELQAK